VTYWFSVWFSPFIRGGLWGTYHLDHNPTQPPLIKGRSRLHEQLDVAPLACAGAAI
jgi:hypothetical protein